MQREARGKAGDGGVRKRRERSLPRSFAAPPHTSTAPGVAADWLIPQEAPQRCLCGECARHVLALEGDKAKYSGRSRTPETRPKGA